MCTFLGHIAVNPINVSEKKKKEVYLVHTCSAWVVGVRRASASYFLRLRSGYARAPPADLLTLPSVRLKKAGVYT